MKDFIIVVLILAVLSYSLPLQEDIRYLRIKYGLRDDFVLTPGEFAMTFVLSGFRGLASDLLWLKVDMLWHSGKWYLMTPTLRMITWLQKDFMAAWGLASWHLGYNLSHYAQTEEDKQKYIGQAIELLKNGIAKNPDRYDLYWELGWFYFDKLENYDEAIRYFRRAIRFEHPLYIDRLIAKAYMEKGEYAKAKKELMRCLELPDADMYHLGIVKKNLRKVEELLNKR
jgi:tetratricopeptide (TPR) repeat protein